MDEFNLSDEEAQKLLKSFFEGQVDNNREVYQFFHQFQRSDGQIDATYDSRLISHSIWTPRSPLRELSSNDAACGIDEMLLEPPTPICISHHDTDFDRTVYLSNILVQVFNETDFMLDRISDPILLQKFKTKEYTSIPSLFKANDLALLLLTKISLLGHENSIITLTHRESLKAIIMSTLHQSYYLLIDTLIYIVYNQQAIILKPSNIFIQDCHYKMCVVLENIIMQIAIRRLYHA